MRDKVLQTTSYYSLLENSDKVIVALSGGADSVALLHCFCSIKEKYNLTLFACHVNHMIRGQEADSDENFCKSLCDNLGVELFVKKIDVPAIAQKEKLSLELCGRNVRYDFFSQLSQQLNAKVATAHTASDNVETVIYNITRGTSMSGLCGIKPKRDNIIRPLIECTREEIEKYCSDNNLLYVTDSTNLSDEYTRNNIRHNVVPTLKEINPKLCETVSRMCDNMTQIKNFFDEYSKKEILNCETEHGYSCQKLLSLDDAVLSNAISLICKEHGVVAQKKHIDLIKEALSIHGCVDLEDQKRAVCKQGVLRINDTYKDVSSFECKLEEYENIEYISKKELNNVNKNFLKDCINCDIISGDTVVRTRREGDSFTFCDRDITKSLKKLFNEIKIPAERRSQILVVANGSTILWIEGIGVSKQARVNKDCSCAVRILEGKRG